MNKTELIAAVASKCSISKKEAEAVVLATFDSITNALERPAHKGHNPMTGEEIEIAASKSPAFKAGKALKEALN